jgi:hypothetical protein
LFLDSPICRNGLAIAAARKACLCVHSPAVYVHEYRLDRVRGDSRAKDVSKRRNNRARPITMRPRFSNLHASRGLVIHECCKIQWRCQGPSG